MALCIKCKTIVCENFFVCSGECSSVVHFACSGIKKPVYDVISAIPNFSWRCCDCIDVNKIKMQRNDLILNSINSITETLNALKDSSSNMNNKIEKIEKIIKPMPLQSPSTLNRNSKTLNSDVPSRFTRSQLTGKSTSTLSSTESHASTLNANNKQDTPNVIIGSGLQNSSLRTVEPLKWIFVSRLHKDIKDDDLNSFIMDKFAINEPKIVRMKRKLESNDRDYVSFKIGVPEDKFDQLLNASSWPSRILIKEFINYRPSSSNNFLVPRSAFKHQDVTS